MREMEFSGSNGRLSREENARRKMANAPPLIRADILRHFGKNDEADEIERRHMSPADYAALQEERRTGAQDASEDEDLKTRLRLAALAV